MLLQKSNCSGRRSSCSEKFFFPSKKKNWSWSCSDTRGCSLAEAKLLRRKKRTSTMRYGYNSRKSGSSLWPTWVTPTTTPSTRSTGDFPDPLVPGGSKTNRQLPEGGGKYSAHRLTRPLTSFQRLCGGEKTIRMT